MSIILPSCRSLCPHVRVFQQTKERVKLLIQLADGFCDKGHAHAVEIKKWVTAVDKRYRDFSLRMDKYRGSLEKALGISSDSNKAVCLCVCVCVCVCVGVCISAASMCPFVCISA